MAWPGYSEDKAFEWINYDNWKQMQSWHFIVPNSKNIQAQLLNRPYLADYAPAQIFAANHGLVLDAHEWVAFIRLAFSIWLDSTDADDLGALLFAIKTRMSGTELLQGLNELRAASLPRLPMKYPIHSYGPTTLQPSDEAATTTLRKKKLAWTWPLKGDDEFQYAYDILTLNYDRTWTLVEFLLLGKATALIKVSKVPLERIFGDASTPTGRDLTYALAQSCPNRAPPLVVNPWLMPYQPHEIPTVDEHDPTYIQLVKPRVWAAMPGMNEDEFDRLHGLAGKVEDYQEVIDAAPTQGLAEGGNLAQASLKGYLATLLYIDETDPLPWPVRDPHPQPERITGASVHEARRTWKPEADEERFLFYEPYHAAMAWNTPHPDPDLQAQLVAEEWDERTLRRNLHATGMQFGIALEVAEWVRSQVDVIRPYELRHLIRTALPPDGRCIFRGMGTKRDFRRWQKAASRQALASQMMRTDNAARWQFLDLTQRVTPPTEVEVREAPDQEPPEPADGNVRIPTSDIADGTLAFPVEIADDESERYSQDGMPEGSTPTRPLLTSALLRWPDEADRVKAYTDINVNHPGREHDIERWVYQNDDSDSVKANTALEIYGTSQFLHNLFSRPSSTTPGVQELVGLLRIRPDLQDDILAWLEGSALFEKGDLIDGIIEFVELTQPPQPNMSVVLRTLGTEVPPPVKTGSGPTQGRLNKPYTKYFAIHDPISQTTMPPVFTILEDHTML